MYFIESIGQKTIPKKVNMNGSEDPFYRYKMKQIQIQVIGKGKMIKTHFQNLDDVAESLGLHPSYIIAYFGYELNQKSESNYVCGSYDLQKWDELLNKMLKDVVMCPKCNLPELTLSIKEKNITNSCRSCGAISEPKLKPKMSNYIVKNPKEQKRKENFGDDGFF